MEPPSVPSNYLVINDGEDSTPTTRLIEKIEKQNAVAATILFRNPESVQSVVEEFHDCIHEFEFTFGGGHRHMVVGRTSPAHRTLPLIRPI